MASIHVRELSHGFAGTGPLFRGLTFHVASGELVAIVGPSGSGKSTLLRLVAGWEAPRQGTIERRGVASTAWVFQNPHGVPRRTAEDHVTLPILAKGARRRDALVQAAEVLDRFGLSQVRTREFRHLSGGEAQRLMLARAAALGPDLLLVDEPTAQLDPATASTVNGVLAGIASARTIVLVATHDARTRDACGRIVDLSQGPQADGALSEAAGEPEV